MPLAQNNPMPTLEEVFGDNPRLLHMFLAAKVRTVVPIMLLPREALRDERLFSGVGARTAKYVTGALAAFGLQHHTIHERLTDFVIEQFGCIEDAPISVLHVATLSDSQQVYAPVRLIHHLEEYEDYMVVGDLAKQDVDSIRHMLSSQVKHGPIIERLAEGVRDINSRLAWWEPGLRIAGSTRQQHLRAVNQ